MEAELNTAARKDLVNCCKLQRAVVEAPGHAQIVHAWLHYSLPKRHRLGVVGEQSRGGVRRGNSLEQLYWKRKVGEDRLLVLYTRGCATSVVESLAWVYQEGHEH